METPEPARNLPARPLVPICDLIRLPEVLQLAWRRSGEPDLIIQLRAAEGTRWQVLASESVDVEGKPVDGQNFLASPGPTPDLQIGDPWR